jgi:hypothetical protein
LGNKNKDMTIEDHNIKEINLSSKKEKIKEMIKVNGIHFMVEIIDDIELLVNFVYDGDIKQYYKENNLLPYKISNDGMVMYIDPLLVEKLNLDDVYYKNHVEKRLGNYRWETGGGNYCFTSYLKPTKMNDVIVYWKVIGNCGDHGFGYSWLTKRNIIGKRGRKQIFKQIIEKYKLDSYL